MNEASTLIIFLIGVTIGVLIHSFIVGCNTGDDDE